MPFFDTNVLVYAVDGHEPDKQRTALGLVRASMEADDMTLSTQVLQEFYSTALRKRLMAGARASELLQLWARHDVVSTTPAMVFRAFDLQQEFGLSIWDALIVQAAIDAGCTTLYSEDLQDGMRFGRLQVVDPFSSPAVHEPAMDYGAARPEGTTAPEIDRLLRDAIHGKRLIRFEYDGLERIGEPHDYGVLNGKDTLNFFQTAGQSRSRREAPWRTLEVGSLRELRVLEDHFEGPRESPSGRHKDWSSIYASVSVRRQPRKARPR